MSGNKMKRKVKNMCLGFSAQMEWEALMIREKMIEQFDIDFSDIELPKPDLLARVNNKSFLLFSMVLFDKIDGSHLSHYDLRKLIDLGLLEENAYMSNRELSDIHKNPVQSLIHDISPETYLHDTKLHGIKELSESIMLESKSRIIQSMIDYSTQNEGGFNYDYNTLLELYESWLTDCEFWAESTDVNHEKDLLGMFKSSIMYGLYDSDSNGSIYFDGSIRSTKHQIHTELPFTQSDICQIMKIDLSPLLYHFPIPQTISEVITLRKRDEIKAFREVFFSWCSLLKTGEFSVAEKIKSDIQLAEKGLEKYRKWEDGKTKVFNCIIDVVVNQIPYLSTILGAIAPFRLFAI
jgi:hypothetical protein